jgi:hypothetical protein
MRGLAVRTEEPDALAPRKAGRGTKTLSPTARSWGHRCILVGCFFVRSSQRTRSSVGLYHLRVFTEPGAAADQGTRRVRRRAGGLRRTVRLRRTGPFCMDCRISRPQEFGSTRPWGNQTALCRARCRGPRRTGCSIGRTDRPGVSFRPCIPTRRSLGIAEGTSSRHRSHRARRREPTRCRCTTRRASLRRNIPMPGPLRARRTPVTRRRTSVEPASQCAPISSGKCSSRKPLCSKVDPTKPESPRASSPTGFRFSTVTATA